MCICEEKKLAGILLIKMKFSVLIPGTPVTPRIRFRIHWNRIHGEILFSRDFRKIIMPFCLDTEEMRDSLAKYFINIIIGK